MRCDSPDREGTFQFRKIVVLGLTPNIDKTDVAAYFNNFGNVEDVVMKPCQKHEHMFFAFVRFSSQSAVETVLSMAPHMIKMRDVRVGQARRHFLHCSTPAPTPVPTCPFPGMNLAGKCLLSEANVDAGAFW